MTGRSIPAVQYQLLDFGHGRKLESIGELVIDRPSPAADGLPKLQPNTWDRTNVRFSKKLGAGNWEMKTRWPDSIAVDCGTFLMPAQPTPYGHIGLFPEQRANWAWIDRFVRHSLCSGKREFRVLNLFAYTGASSIAAAITDRDASGGTETRVMVTHVDAAKPNVEAAKRAAKLNGIDWIRFIVDDARKFVSREQRRGKRYDLIILDPPAYGHGSTGNAWRLERDLWPLLTDCLQVTESTLGAMVVTGHSATCSPRDVSDWFAQRLVRRAAIEHGRLELCDVKKRKLDAGMFVRVAWGNEV